MSDTLTRRRDRTTVGRGASQANRRDWSDEDAFPVGWERDTERPNPAGWLSLDE